MSETLLAVDPGLRYVGFAYFVGPKLTYANYLANPATEGDMPPAWFAMADAVYFHFKERGYRVDHYAVEVMQIYRNSPNPQKLIPLVGVGAAIGASFPLKSAAGYLPRQWKGVIKKEKHHPLILAQLDPDEIEAIAEKRKTYREHVIDAIGIGLWHLERTSVRFSK